MREHLDAALLNAWATSLPTEPDRLSSLMHTLGQHSEAAGAHETREWWSKFISTFPHGHFVSVLLAVNPEAKGALDGPAIVWPWPPPHDVSAESAT